MTYQFDDVLTKGGMTMKHRLHPISFKAALNHIEQGNYGKVYVRIASSYRRVDQCRDMSLIEWAKAEYHVEEAIDE